MDTVHACACVCMCVCVWRTYRPLTHSHTYLLTSPPPTHTHTNTHVSTGLSACTGIAEYVLSLLGSAEGITNSHQEGTGACMKTETETGMRGEKIMGVSLAVLAPIATARRVKQLPSVPPLAELAQEYRERGDGRVTLYGRSWPVTHPISRAGFESLGVDGSGPPPPC